MRAVMAIHVHEVTGVSPELVGAFVSLTPQLSRSAPPPARPNSAKIVVSPATVPSVATLDDDGADEGSGPIVGSLTLALFRIPTGLRAWIEDVVVDGDVVPARGVGEALNLHAIAVAQAWGAKKGASPPAECEGGQPAVSAARLQTPPAD